MAKEEATLIIRIKQIGKKGLKAIPGMLKGIGKAALAGAVGLVGFAAAVVKLAQEASQFETVRQSFENLAASQGQDADKMLDKMRELSRGTISDLKLMQQANQSLLLGLPVDRFGDMLEIARSAAQATGQSMDFMLNSIVTGLGRGSKLMLDNLGIVFKTEDAYAEYARTLGKTAEQLTEAEKKQAFINKALETGLKNAKAAGGGQLTLSERVQQVSARFENLRIVIGQRLGPVLAFFLEETEELFQQMEKITRSGAMVPIFTTLAKVVSITKNAFVVLGKIIGTSIAGAVQQVTAIADLEFKKAARSVVAVQKEIKTIVIDAKKETEEEFASIDQKFRDAEKKRVVDTEAAKKIHREQARQEELAAKEAEREGEVQRRIEEQEEDLAFFDASEQQIIDLLLQKNAEQFQNAKSHKERMRALNEKEALLQTKLQLKQAEEQKKTDEKKEADRKASLSRIASLQNSNNKTLAAIGKAAALTQIAIETPVAVAKAFSAFPPPFNFVAAAAVAAAMAAQAARVAGVQLAEGGVVLPTQGGTPAIIGEGGRAEAVVPLPEDFDPDEGGVGAGGTTVININGATLGTPEEAREFARMIDQSLLELRRSNESVSFEEDVI